jgi:hypothetical protein
MNMVTRLAEPGHHEAHAGDQDDLAADHVGRLRGPDVGRRVVVTLHDEPVRGVAADDAVDDQPTGAGIALRDPVRDDLAPLVVVRRQGEDHVAGVEGRLHRMAGHDDEPGRVARCQRPQQEHRDDQQGGQDGAGEDLQGPPHW